MDRITYNFISASQAGKTQEEANANLVYKKKNDKDNLRFDRRNGIYCINPTNDFECYYNYIQYLNQRIDQWKGYGYLDVGLVPILMAPSFMADQLNEGIAEVAKAWGIPIYRRKAISLLNNRYLSSTMDAWVKKSDLASILGCPIEEATLSTMLKRLKGGD